MENYGIERRQRIIQQYFSVIDVVTKQKVLLETF